MIGWIALGVTIALFAAVAWRVDDWSRDWTQNTASLKSDADRPELRPLEMSVNADEVLSRIEGFCQQNRNWQIRSVEPREEGKAQQGDEKLLTVNLTRTTPLFRFVDDIKVTIRPNSSSDGVVVDASSSSRVGKGDLGQNPRNLMELTRHLAPAD